MTIENKLNLTFDSVCLVSPAFVHLLAHAAVLFFFLQHFDMSGCRIEEKEKQKLNRWTWSSGYFSSFQVFLKVITFILYSLLQTCNKVGSTLALALTGAMYGFCIMFCKSQMTNLVVNHDQYRILRPILMTDTSDLKSQALLLLYFRDKTDFPNVYYV